MRVAMTGASGHLGSQIYDFLCTNYDVLRFGRRAGEISWEMGRVPQEEDLLGVSAIFHFAWSLRDREKDSNLNVFGTEKIAELAQKLKIPLVFISSTAVFSESRYGASKLAAEKIVSGLGGLNLRIGVVPTANRTIDIERWTYFQLIPTIKSGIHFTDFKDLTGWISTYLNGLPKENKVLNFTLVTGHSEIASLYSDKYWFRICVPEKLIINLLSFFSLFSRNFRNKKDSVIAILTTPQVLN
jgi:hypothetical protein